MLSTSARIARSLMRVLVRAMRFLAFAICDTSASCRVAAWNRRLNSAWCADSARTVAVGVVSAPARALVDATREALARAIAECVPGRRLGDLGAAVEGCAAEHGFAVVRDFVGHGIGRRMHEQPSVPNHGRPGTGLRLKPGMVLAIEPMLNAGSGRIRMLDDGWTVVTADGALSAHVEHTVAITVDGPAILTAAA